MSKLYVDHLVLETTRRCNMHCEHCLRGNAQDLDMSTVHIRTLLSQVNEIHEVTFTGGEPSLNLMTIRKFVEIAKENNIRIGRFFLATNGKENQEELAMLLLRLYQSVEDPDGSSVALSIDPYHDENIDTLVMGLKFYDNCKEHDPTDMSDTNWIINTGRAYDNDLGTHNLDIPEKFEIQWSYDENNRVKPDSLGIDEIYLSCNGYLYTSCDMSYTAMDANKKLHVKYLTSYVAQEIANSDPQFDPSEILSHV